MKLKPLVQVFHIDDLRVLVNLRVQVNQYRHIDWETSKVCDSLNKSCKQSSSFILLVVTSEQEKQRLVMLCVGTACKMDNTPATVLGSLSGAELSLEGKVRQKMQSVVQFSAPG